MAAANPHIMLSCPFENSIPESGVPFAEHQLVLDRGSEEKSAYLERKTLIHTGTT